MQHKPINLRRAFSSERQQSPYAVRSLSRGKGSRFMEVSDVRKGLEIELEEGVHAYLSTHFCRDIASPFRGQDFIVANTARGGERGGRWTRPDLTLVAIQKYRFPDAVRVELFGFEIKRDSHADISSVFEAVAHTRFVHYAYVVWQVLEGSEAYKVAKEIETNCQIHGIGLITFSDALIPATYRTRATPIRQYPHTWDVDEYLQKRLQDADQHCLLSKINKLQGLPS